jgi:hypothetical protein
MENKKKTFKENWLKVDETCPNCGQVTKRQRGLTKQNLKRLIIPQWNSTEILITLMLIFIIILAYVYSFETKQCKEWISSMTAGGKEICRMNCNLQCDKIKEEENTNLTNLNLTIINNP